MYLQSLLSYGPGVIVRQSHTTYRGHANSFFVRDVLTREMNTRYLELFILCWTSANVGYSNRFRIDEESNFASNESRIISENADIEISLSGIQTHNSLDVGERYLGPLQTNFYEDSGRRI